MSVAASSHSRLRSWSISALLAGFVRGGVMAAGLLLCGLFLGAPLDIGGARADGAVALDRLEVVTAKGPVAFVVEVVDTDETRARGLMFRTEMAPDHGMLFDFRREEPVWFWMKNTYLPLDMIFARADGTVVAVAENTTPLSEALVPSGGPVRFVFEVVAGTSARLGIRVGDRLRHARVRTPG